MEMELRMGMAEAEISNLYNNLQPKNFRPLQNFAPKRSA